MKHISIITILLLAVFSLSAHEIKDGVLYISDGTTEIRGQAFAQNGKFSKVIIPKSVTKIGNMAFMKCRNLKEIEIPSSVKYIGKAAFQMCTSLEKLTLHDGVEQIQFRAFKSTSLRSVSLPKSVKTVGGEAFADCKKLNTISVVKYSMSHTFFVSDQRLAFSDDAPANTYDEWIDASLSLTEKSFLENGILHIHPSRTEIKNQQYAMKTNFTKVILPPTITKIGNMAFMKCYNLKEIEIPPNVKHIGNAAFQLCTSLEKVTLHDGLEKLSFRLFKSSAIKQIEIPSTVKFIYDEVFADCKNLMVFTDRRTNIMDISPKYEIPDNFTIPEGMRLRVKAGSAADKWAVRKGLSLCGVLSCFNEYSADKSLAITEDFTRILGDDESWFDRTGYSFEIKKPLKIEEIDGNIVLTSFMLKPCRNVTVTVGGTKYIDRKTIQPLTRTVICNAAGVDAGSFSLTTDDPLYKSLSSIPVNWTISFDGFVRQPSTPEKNFTRTNRPVFCRQWIQNIYNLAYTIGSDEYRDQCMESAKNRWLVTDEAQTKFLTEDEMEALYKKATNWKLRLGRCGGIAAGLGGGYFLALDTTMLMNIAACTRAGLVSGFFHELSHCMGYGHKAGNMCNQGAKNGYGEKSWQMIGGKIYVKQFKNGEVPYTLGRQLLNGDFFCSDQYNLEDPKNDIVKNRTLYIADGMPYTVSHKNETNFTGIEFPLSVQKISSQAFCNTKVQSVAFPKSLRKIDKSAFQNCKDLVNVTFADGLKEIGDGAFRYTGITEVIIPQSVTKIGKGAFYRKDATIIITVPDSVTEFGEYCTSSRSVWIVSKNSAAYKYATAHGCEIILSDDTYKLEQLQKIKADAKHRKPDTNQNDDPLDLEQEDDNDEYNIDVPIEADDEAELTGRDNEAEDDDEADGDDEEEK